MPISILVNPKQPILHHYNGSRMRCIRPLILLLVSLCAWAQPAQKTDLTGAAHKSLAIVSGQMPIKGLEQPVEVLRDRWGVAHIYSGSAPVRDASPKFSDPPRCPAM
jgi:acyl-homoserine lactone acylase PvdQ